MKKILIIIIIIITTISCELFDSNYWERVERKLALVVVMMRMVIIIVDINNIN